MYIESGSISTVVGADIKSTSGMSVAYFAPVDMIKGTWGVTIDDDADHDEALYLEKRKRTFSELDTSTFETLEETEVSLQLVCLLEPRLCFYYVL